MTGTCRNAAMLSFDRTNPRFAYAISVVAVAGPVVGCCALAGLVYYAGVLELAIYLSLVLFGWMIYR